MIYLDYNARAPLRPEAVRAFAQAAQLVGNPSSLHAAGRAARNLIEEARVELADLLETHPEEVIFTSGGTEANYLALAQAKPNGCGVCLVGASEHPSLLEAASATGLPVELLPVDASGAVLPETLAAALAQHQGKRAFVAVMMANHETGCIQPIAELAALARDAGALFHCDGVQGFGKVPLALPSLGVDFLALASAKLGGAPGCGALVLARDMAITPLFPGGQERGRRAGTENLPAIASFAAAARAAINDLPQFARLVELRDELEQSVRRHFPQALFFAAQGERLANTSCFTLPNFSSQQSLIMLDLAGICLSAGAACSSGKIGASHVLQAMGAADDEAATALRASLGYASTQEDIAAFDVALASIATRRAA